MAAKEAKSLKFYVISRSFDLAGIFVRSAMWVAIAYIVYLGTIELAGKSTDAKFMVAYFTSAENDHGLPWILVVLFLTWALYERRLRLAKVEHFQSRIRELETRIDPQRSSSGLTQRGETNPDDRL